MSSKVVIKDKKHSGNISRMAIALKDMVGGIGDEPKGLYQHKVEIKVGNLKIVNDEYDIEFNVPFDDDAEANEAEITIYNICRTTADTLYSFRRKNEKLFITAGYGLNVGIIFTGYISTYKTYWDADHGLVTVITAIDNEGAKETELQSVSFGSNTRASAVLSSLVYGVGLPVAVFEVKKDYTYKDKVTVSGGRLENIKKYARICGVVAYICKGKFYVCPLTWGTHDTFELSADTGLLSASPFEEEARVEEYTETITGQDIEMLLQHRVQTGSIIKLNSMNAKGEYRVREGRHTYDGNNFKTVVKAISYSCIVK